MNEWKIHSTSSSLEINRVQSLLLKSIGCSIFSSIICNLCNSSIRGTYGYLITSVQGNNRFVLPYIFIAEFQLYQWCRNFCKNAFWISSNAKLDRKDPIYTIKLFDYLSPCRDANWWYTNSGYIGSCCCNVCVYLCKRLREHHSSSSNTILEDIIRKESHLLLQFLKHNSKWPILEHRLLSITLDGLIAQRDLVKNCRTLKTNLDGELMCLFKNNGIFVICKDFDIFLEYNIEGSTNTGSLLLDLILEYTGLWNKLNLPIFLFMLCKDRGFKALNKNPNLDGKSDLLLKNDSISFLSRISYIKVNFYLKSDFLADENTMCRYLEQSLNIIKHFNLVSKRMNRNEISIYTDLMKMVQGYTLEELKTLVRHVNCELLNIASNKHINEISGWLLIRDSLQKAISLRPPLHLLDHMPTTYRIYHKTFPVPDEIAPLEIDHLGNLNYKKGLSRMVLSDGVYHQVVSFLDETINPDAANGLIIDGPSGSGKTTLAISIAWELGGILIIANILDFLRPQVGFSEKLIHNFFHSIQIQFNKCLKEGTRRSSTQCTVLFEGLDTLNSTDAGYIKRTISALCMEMDSFATNSRFLSNKSVLFICTANKASEIPKKLRTRGRFEHVLTLSGDVADSSLLKSCFELYLNARCDFMDRVDQIVAKIASYRGKYTINPAIITKMCKEAAYYNIKTLGGLSQSTITISNMLNVIDSTFV
ncbi:ATPase, AAA family domain-containing protein [Theileria equi strain WA]|uniref:ATPase, AAA family domain-containing protein n=1 Tax=Theileria equi strain WA TaxID=1537102 RepID=L0B1M4_THEEQ|nr:ATPase, AAA family domain-containing protein [Theileria equi strain WA]AFZ81735.1 ATPase, AAA family domain-containing protein [Theileria equi strain WA]|eukprot:XP_004831401.1 ATPase, AAA family domain-containing protein [Theileria equi strain WA]